MGLSVFPAPSSSSSQYPTAGAVVASSTETKGFYSTTLGAGTYLVTALSGGNAYTSTYYTATAPNTFAMHAYNNNIWSAQNECNSPVVLKLTTSDTVYLSSNLSKVGDLSAENQYYFHNADQGHSYDTHLIKSWTDKTKYMLVHFNNGHTYCFVAPVSFHQMPTAGQTWSRVFPSVQVWANDTTHPMFYAHVQGIYYIGRDGGSLYQSTDGVTWSVPTITGYAGTSTNLVYGSFNNYWVVVSDNSSATANIASSTNGTTWTTRNSAIASNLYSITTGNNIFVAVGNNGSITTSTDSITWSARTSPQTGTAWSSVAFQNGIFLAVANGISNNVSVAYSTNGTTWTGIQPTLNKAGESLGTQNSENLRKSSTIMIPATKQYKSALFTGGGYFFIQYGATVHVSTDGISWGTLYRGTVVNYNYSGRHYWDNTYGLMAYVSQSNNNIGFAYPAASTFVIYQSTVA